MVCARGNDVSHPQQVSQSMSRALQSGKPSAVCSQGPRPELFSLGFGSCLFCCSSDGTRLAVSDCSDGIFLLK